MRPVIVIQRLTGLLVATALLGCDLSYTGGFRMSGQDRKSVDAYHEYLRQRDLALQSPPSGEAGAASAAPLATVDAFGQEPMILPGGESKVPGGGTASLAGNWGQSPAAAPIGYAPSVQSAAMAGSTHTSVQFAAETVAARPGPSAAPTPRPVGVFGNLPVSNPSSPAVSMDGSDNVTRVTFATEGGDFDPTTDPSGQWLAFASTRHRKTSDIYIKQIDGQTVTQITNDPADDVMPAFSPDGQRLAFASNRSGQWDIYIVDIRGGQPVQITSDPMQEISPTFSPDGRQLAFCCYGAQSGQWELVVVDIERPAIRKFIGYGLFPQWSPQGNRILFQRARERGTQWFSIWTVDLVNGEALRPTEIIASANAAVITPSWSPDGRHIVFSTVVSPRSGSTDRPVQADVWVASIEGSGRANLTRSAFANLQPRWGRDGAIYFVSSRGAGGVENIWSVKPDRVLELTRTLTTVAQKGGAKAADAAAMVPMDKP